MEASAGLVAGSHNRNELVVIRRDGDPGPKPLRQQKRQVCQICGDGVGLTPDGEPFVACNECAFPVYRDCYGYERREGMQNCPQCKTRFKRLKGCARVPRDEEEDGVDDLENEFNWRDRNDSQSMTSRQSSTRLCRLSWAAGGKRIHRRAPDPAIQDFHVLYHTDNNVLLGAPTGSGKTISAELAMLYLLNTQLDMKCEKE